MVGLVLVSHSAAVAEGAAALAREMAGPDLAIEAAGGLDEPDWPLGTDPALVAGAIERADSGAGVVVLMDLGSAVLSAETALELVADDEVRGRVVLSAAPLVEGAVSAAVAARTGAGADEVAGEARRGLEPKERDLGEEAAGPSATAGSGGGSAGGDVSTDEGARGGGASATGGGSSLELRLTVENAHGLHARPAARLVRTARSFDARVELSNATEERGPVSAASFADVATLGVRHGHELVVRASGPQARELIDAVEKLAHDRFGEADADGPALDEGAPSGAAGAEPVTPAEPAQVMPADGSRLVGVPAAPGLAAGPAHRLRRAPVPTPTGATGSPEEERAALDAALEGARHDLAGARDEAADRAGAAAAEILDAHLLVLEDEGLLDPARNAIADDGRSAGEAFAAAVHATADRFRALQDPYLRARADDVEDAGGRVVKRLAGSGEAPTLPEPGIVLVEDLTPTEVLDLPADVVHGIATARGAATSHASVLARGLGVPAVVGLGPDLLAVPEGTMLLLDGATGEVVVGPDAETRTAHERRMGEEQAALTKARDAAHEPALTRDGRPVVVSANVTSVADVRAAVKAGADGVGLLRTEFLFHGRDAAPDEDEQEAAVREIAETLDGRPLVVRTLDAGADKPLPYLARRREENPFLGVRGLRLSLAEPNLLVTQLRAALRVAADHPLSLMFPMVTTVAELTAARELVFTARADLRREGISTPEVPVGAMVEVPAAALSAERLAENAAFLSIGTNDLVQYTLAAERGNADVAALADGLSPPVLELVARVVEACARHGRKVSVCGDLAADPQAVPVLVGLGVEELSVVGAAVPVVKAAVRKLDYPRARDLAAEAVSMASAAEVRELVGA